MELRWWGHACVSIDHDGERVVIDPGTFASASAALEGATHVLVTHEHADHLDREALAGSAAAVYGPASVVATLAEVVPAASLRVVVAGDRLTLAGLDVEVVGEQHQVIHPDLPAIANVGYVISGLLLHPGDSLAPVAVDVPVLLAPVGGPWLRAADLIDFIRHVHPRTVIPIHDATLSSAGVSLMHGLVTRLGGATLRAPALGEPVDLTAL